MSNTPNQNTPPPDMLDRENDEALTQSTDQQYSAISYLLGLPTIRELPTANERDISTRIAGHINRARGRIASDVRLERLLHAAYQRELAVSVQSHPATSMEGFGQPVGIERAEAWMRVVLQHFTEQDVRGLIEQIPASIRTVAGGHMWHASAVRVSAAGTRNPLRNVYIDLSHPVWRSGNAQTIGARLATLTPEEAGVRFDPPRPRINQMNTALLNAIFGTQVNVIDPDLPLQVLQFDNLPPGRRTVFDFPRLIREHPGAARSNQAQLEILLRPILNNFVNTYDATTGRRATRPSAADVAREVFGHLNRAPTRAIASRMSTLTHALQVREPLERLLSGSADNRELILALATIQRDPQARSVIAAASAGEAEIREKLNTNKQLLALSKAVKNLEDSELPEFSDVDITDGMTAMQRVMFNASSARTRRNGVSVDLYDGLPTGGNERIQAGKRGIPEKIIKVIVKPFVQAGVVIAPGRDNMEEFVKVSEIAQKALGKYQEAQKKRNNILRQLQSVIATLQSQQILFAAIETGGYPLLRDLILFPPLPAPATGYGVKADNINEHLDIAAVSRELTTVLRDANPQHRVDLQSVEHYDEEYKDLTKKLQDAAKNKDAQGGPHGSEACWEVVKKGLQDQGIRGPELESTMLYMRNKLKRTNTAVRDIKQLAESEFPYLKKDNLFWEEESIKEWRKGKGYFLLNNSWQRYTGRLFNNLGIHLEDLAAYDTSAPVKAKRHNPRQRRFRIPELLNAYFCTKYLTKLPASDPRHLPEAPIVVRYLRSLHGAIIDRMQENYENAVGGKEQLEAMGIDPNMNITQKIQAAHNFLQNDQSYLARNQALFDKVSQEAYRPIQKRINRRDKLKGGLKTVGRYVGKALIFAPWTAPKWTWQKLIKPNGRPILAGAIVGTLLSPGLLPGFGTLFGAVAAPVGYKLYKYLAGGGGGASGAAPHS